jgi:hypothetical protein
MSERLSGFQQMDHNAREHIAATKVAANEAMNATHVEALAMDQQIDTGAEWAAKLNAAEARVISPKGKNTRKIGEVNVCAQ